MKAPRIPDVSKGMGFDPKRAEKLKHRSLDILVRNRRTTPGGFQYTVPSPSTYPYQWLWDSCFHAIALTHFSVEDAKKELRSAVSQQFDNGMLPHMIYWEPGELIDISWGREARERTSTITQPPIIAEAAWRIFEKDGDEAFLQEMYPALRSYYEYLLMVRDPRGNHLSGIINPDESGEDNSPRFDVVLGLPSMQTLEENFKTRLKLVEELRSANFDAIGLKQVFWVKDVPFNAMLVENLRVLAQIAKSVGAEEGAERYANEASLVEGAMRERMFDGQLFWSTYGESYVTIPVKTWAIFVPLYAGSLSQTEADALIDDHLLNPAEFRTPFSVPTVALDQDTFDPTGFWRGPTWIAVNWFVFRGLLRYGRKELAAEILETSAQLLEHSGFREYYNPHTGEGLGAQEFTWGALIVDMFARFDEAQRKNP